MRIIFIGPPGAGKGTQAEKLIRYLSIPHLSTGDMLRRAQQLDSEVGKFVGKYMTAGQLVPDAVVLRMVAERMSEPDCNSGCLLDGFPRTLGQARALDDYLQQRGTPVDAVIQLELDEEELFRRLAGRARSDDSPSVIRQRLMSFREQTRPLLDYYSKQGLLETIDAGGTPDEVFARIEAAIERHKR